MKFFFSFLFLFSDNALASKELVRFENSYLFSQQTLGSDFSLPIELSVKVPLIIEFTIDSESQTKLLRVFSGHYAVDDLEAKLQIYYFNLPAEKYFAQQIEIFKSKTLIAKCASYFGREQSYLVPGVCSGVSNNSLFGFVLYRAPQ